MAAIDWLYYEALRKAVRALVDRAMTVAQISDALNDQGIRTVQGNAWTPSALEWVMRHRLGISTATYQRRLPSRRKNNNNKEKTA